MNIDMMHNMKTSLLVLVAMSVLSVSCDRFEVKEKVFDNSVYLDVSAKHSVQPASFSKKAYALTKTLSVEMAYPEEEDVTVTVSVDNALVSAYNSKYGTDYEPVPQQYMDFSESTVTIPAGKTTSETIGINLKGLRGEGAEETGAMEIDHNYLLPVRITSAGISSMKGADVAYYLVRRTSAITTAADLTDNWIKFPLLDQPGPQADAYNGLTAITYEALININRFDLSNGFGACAISTIMGVEQYCLLRIGDVKFERQQLQFDGSGGGSEFGKFPEADPAKKLYEGEWYHVACTFDQNTRTVCMYVNGKLQSEGKEMGAAAGGGSVINLAMQALGEKEAYQFFIGRSYNEYRPLQGKIAEARVWKVARTADQIWDSMYRLTEKEEQSEDLLGYWKFDEGEGNVIKDWSIHHNDGIAEKDIIWPDGVEIPEINKKEESL